MSMCDLIIIGGGPAGLAAGIQAGHMGMEVKILERHTWGGRLCLARKVENVPGLAQPLSGEQLVQTILGQARGKGLSMAKESCTEVDYTEPWFSVATTENQHAGRAVILACGVQPKQVLVPGIDPGAGCIFSSWRDLPDVTGTSIAVIGGGEAAFDQACTLAEHGAAVTVLVRASEPKAFQGLVLEAIGLGVKVLMGTHIHAAARRGHLVSLDLGDTHQGIDVHYLLAAVGTTPTELTVSRNARQRTGKGLYNAGDMSSGPYRQVAIAFGDGIKKAMMAYEYVRGE
jgi:NADH-dependent peroxiredoxin subunit F